MSAPTLERANPFTDFAEAESFDAATTAQLPVVFRAQLNAWDEPVQGDLLDASMALPGDYVLSESGNWLRVLEVSADADGCMVIAGRAPGVGLPVAAGRSVWVWRAADVLAWAVLGESAGVL